jgi:glycyl-tRNA synthetase beta chain
VSTFLLEIGTEELPADFARLALPQLETLVGRDLLAARLRHGAIAVTSTPRRLAISVAGLALAQSDLVEERKGPPAGQAFKDGVPTQAAKGFASRCGIGVAALEVRETAKGPFLFATVQEPGRPTAAVLAELILSWIGALQGRRFMRWGEGESRFSRPVRWLVALLDAELLAVELQGCDPPLRAGRYSRGHRLQSQSVEIPNAEAYAECLAAAGVQVNRSQRAQLIRQQVDSAAAALGARPDLPEQLFDELTDLVEAPLLIEGDIADAYLDLPAEVLSTVMRSHQRYVPLYRADAQQDPLALAARGSLLPRFLCIGNGLAAATDTVRRGNERVLKARLADAQFFINADRAVPSIDRRDQLARVSFAEGLGSLLNRVERMEWCTDALLLQLGTDSAMGTNSAMGGDSAMGIDTTTADQARRATHLCKHDLVSQMVGEFPELQGVIGGKYLLAEGEERQVALAVLEHYLPKGAGDALPGSAAGALVALAERLELLLSIYAKGERPSGSSDPYALRRAGNGLLQILWDRGWTLNLEALLQRATSHWAALLPELKLDAASLAGELGEFLRQRLLSLLEEQGLDADLVQAVAGETVALERVLRDPADARQRAELLAQLRASGELAAVQAVVTRAARLAEKGDLGLDQISPSQLVQPELFEQPSEEAMLEVLQQLEPIAGGNSSNRYQLLTERLASSAPTLAAFFDGDHSVMVMAENLEIRRNRLNLLALLRNQAAVLADFSRISG